MSPKGGKEANALGDFMDGSKEIMDFVLEERKTKRVSFIDAVMINI